MEIKIIEMGVGFEIRIIMNEIRFYTHKEFENVEEARDFLEQHGLKETS